MFPVEAFERTIGKFVAIAEAIKLPFHLTGGSISSAYGEPRLTQDIDIVVSPDVAKNRVDVLVDQLTSSDFCSQRVSCGKQFKPENYSNFWTRAKA